MNNYHTYFVGVNGALSHNAGVCKFPEFGTSARNHIFRGDISEGGAISGYHHRFGGSDSGTLKLLNVTARGKGAKGTQGAVYEAWVGYVDKRGITHKKLSTFFPDNWTSHRVIMEINSALISVSSKGKVTGKIRATSASGIKIEMVIENGSLITAYPVLR